MGIIAESMDRYYEKLYRKLFTRLSEAMDRLSEEKIFNKEGAKLLMKEYEGLVTKTCNNVSLPDNERKNWFDLIINNYNPSLSKLISRYKSE